MRYKVINKSVSVHCCFEFTVVDTELKNDFDEPSSICETFYGEDANKICNALNKQEAQDEEG